MTKANDLKLQVVQMIEADHKQLADLALTFFEVIDFFEINIEDKEFSVADTAEEAKHWGATFTLEQEKYIASLK